jgi:hypothetical protein
VQEPALAVLTERATAKEEAVVSELCAWHPPRALEPVLALRLLAGPATSLASLRVLVLEWEAASARERASRVSELRVRLRQQAREREPAT